MKNNKRVVVTGMGIASPLGSSLASNWDALVNGQSGISKITQFDTKDFEINIAGEIKDFDPLSVITQKELKKIDRFSYLAIHAADEALKDSGLQALEDEEIQKNMGALVGVGMGGLAKIQEQTLLLKEKGPKRITPFFIPQVIGNMASGLISIRHKLKGPNYAVTSACASGAHSIGEAFRYIQTGRQTYMLAGGSESVICELAVGGFAAMKALSKNVSDPKLASRPFDKDRDGFVLSEGAGILILEEYENAKSRGAKIYGEIVGYGASSDGYHMAAPEPEGLGAAKAMSTALQDAELNADKISYINAHGTSTPAGDRIETDAIKKVFKDHASNLIVNSTKSMMGHTLGAAGAIESIFTLLAIKNQCSPPTINIETPDELCDLDYCANITKDLPIEYALNNSFGFGGTNASIVFKKI